MSLFSRTKQKPLDRRRSLTGVPVMNENVTIEPADGDNLILTVKLQRGRGLLARFQPAVMTRRVKLDQLGSFVVRQIDGKRSVLEIIDLFVERYKTNRREAELSVVSFLKSLIERHVVSVAIK